MSRSDRRYGIPAWRKLTREIQARDHWQCQYCGRPSWCADHVLRPDQGGSFWDPSNLVAACRSCNTGRRYGDAWVPPRLRSSSPSSVRPVAFRPALLKKPRIY